MNRRNILLASAVAAATVFSPSIASAQDTGQPIRLIVPYAPGGPIDVTARALAERVRDSLGTVIIDNKGGASGILGRRRATALQQREYARNVAATPRDAASIIVAIPPMVSSTPAGTPLEAQNASFQSSWRRSSRAWSRPQPRRWATSSA